MSTNKPTKSFIVIGIDFGTTSGSDTSWGYSVPADKDALKWFKLLLIDEKDMPAKITNSSQFQRSRELLETMKKGPIDAIACFFK
ncbi:unnamed protein product [Fusarium graminearum]|uniref:Uncharacterized protein n=1 Tax=Gibberella zeae TaxID=5518 RepID=A0A4E9EFL9_GIBZA|nr:unnamed protein product [Fusarium graminearum]CAF3577350.1 unnamed protein product [Fusarium graminearum]CAG1986665.1 unnamed protein product [Fusarium graminearum]CAG2014070.1 unnamed protein product [Fusarium graminearum]